MTSGGFGLAQNYPGRLFIVEGIDGSGKSTQLTLLSQWRRIRLVDDEQPTRFVY